MQVLQRFHDASRVKLSSSIYEITVVSELRPKFAAQAGLHEHVHVPEMNAGVLITCKAFQFESLKVLQALVVQFRCALIFV